MTRGPPNDAAPHQPAPLLFGSLLLMIALAQVGWGKYLLPSPWLGGIPIAVGVLIAFVAIIRLHFIRHEEVLMAETIGDRYLPYQRQVRRWM